MVTLREIAQLLQDQVEGRHDLAGAWLGWRIRQNRLIPPGEAFRQSQITPTNLRAFARWLRSLEGEQAQLEFRTEPRRESCAAPRQVAPLHQQASKAGRSCTPPCPPPLGADRADMPEHFDAPVPGQRQGLAQGQPQKPRQRENVIQLAASLRLRRFRLTPLVARISHRPRTDYRARPPRSGGTGSPRRRNACPAPYGTCSGHHPRPRRTGEAPS